MSDTEIDELFGDTGGSPEPRSRLVVTLLVTGLLLALFGLACTSVPGAGVVLIAWYVVGKDLDRVDNGYLPADTRPQVRRLQQATWAAVVVVLVLFAIQGWLLSAGVYDVLWGEAIRSLGNALGADTLPAS